MSRSYENMSTDAKVMSGGKLRNFVHKTASYLKEAIIKFISDKSLEIWFIYRVQLHSDRFNVMNQCLYLWSEEHYLFLCIALLCPQQLTHWSWSTSNPHLLVFLSSEGHIYVDLNHPLNSSEEAILASNPHILPGGAGHPIDCAARHKVAIILPYRDRQMHLQILLSHLHPLLHRQQLDYRIIVVEQVGDSVWCISMPLKIPMHLFVTVFAVWTGHFQQSPYHEHSLCRGTEALSLPVCHLPWCRSGARGRSQHVFLPSFAPPYVCGYRWNGLQVSTS